ncbi:hypothetical protein ACQKP7_20310 [Pseudomonas frederiksbergensis]|jgi:hypothetical protein|uniref:hypothetical protein n=1 Tax=Pseudomonas TaxID=286 RepID=UPI0011F1E2BB|nr:hypothetical protein [Pseudomonas sp. ANT_J12]KAA0994458.1 hypothetical protein FQ192_14100 [Pseudomonas sp. ANT_J12]
MEKKTFGLIALLAGVAAISSTVQADEVKPANPFVAEYKMQPGNKVVAYGQLPCTSQELAYMRKHGFTPLCN